MELLTEDERRSLRRHLVLCRVLWTLTAVLAVTGVVLGIFPTGEPANVEQAANRLTAQNIGRAAQPAGLTMAVCAWASEERRSKRESRLATVAADRYRRRTA